MAEYEGSIELISGITQKNGGTFPLVDASAVQIDESGTRLNGWIKTLNASALVLGEQDMWLQDVSQYPELIYNATPIAPFSPDTAYIIKTTCENNAAEIWIQYEYSQEWHNAHPSSEGGVQVIKDTGVGLQDKAFTTKSLTDGVINIVKIIAKGFTEEEISNTNIVPYNTTYSVAESGYTIAAGENSHAEGRSTKAFAPFSHVEGSGTLAGVSVMSNLGNSAHAEGSNTSATGNFSHSEGQNTSAQGSYSHAEGNSTLSYGKGAHAEGRGKLETKQINNKTYNESGAHGEYSHSEGDGTWATGKSAHAEGYNAVASGMYAHAEGNSSTASGDDSHAEGSATASAQGSHAENMGIASGEYSHAENTATASGKYSHAEGVSTIANHSSQHVFGAYNIADNALTTEQYRGNYIEIVGNGSSDNVRSNARTLKWNGDEWIAGKLTVGSAPTDNMDVATKQYVDSAVSANDAMVFKGTIGSSGATVSSLPATHKTGWAYKVATAGTYAGVSCEVGDMIICVTDGTSNNNSHWAVLQSNIDPDIYALKNNPVFTGSISLGRKSNTGAGTGSFAVGSNVTALGGYTHAEGINTTADGTASHAEGYQTQATGDYSHAEGRSTTATGGYASHAEGNATEASGGWGSHAEGHGTIANHKAQHTFGEYNIADTSSAGANERGNFIEIVGNGTSSNVRSNARTLDWYGNEMIAGSLSRSRKADTVIGAGSIAFGVHTEASGIGSQTFGIMTQAREDGSFAVGIANQDQRTEIIWNKTTSYSSGDIVCIHKGTGLPKQDGVSVLAGRDHYFIAKKNVTAGKWPLDANENPDNTDYWKEIPKLILTVGNGRISGEYEEMEPMLAGDSTRRNAFAVDRDGNGFFDGDVYVNADSKSINGTKLATESYVDTAIENDLTMVADFGTISAGTYTNTEFITEGVTASYKAISIELGDSSAVSTPVDIQTSASTITLSAKFEQATTMKVVLIKCAKTVTAYETVLASDEEEIIPG